MKDGFVTVCIAVCTSTSTVMCAFDNTLSVLSDVQKLNHLLKATPRWGPAVRVVSRQEYNPLPVDPFIPTTDHMQCGQDPYETKI